MTQAREWYKSDRDYKILAQQKYLGAEWDCHYRVTTYYYLFPDNSLVFIDIDEDGNIYEDYANDIEYLDDERVELNTNIKSVFCEEVNMTQAEKWCLEAAVDAAPPEEGEFLGVFSEDDPYYLLMAYRMPDGSLVSRETYDIDSHEPWDYAENCDYLDLLEFEQELSDKYRELYG